MAADGGGIGSPGVAVGYLISGGRRHSPRRVSVPSAVHMVQVPYATPPPPARPSATSPVQTPRVRHQSPGRPSQCWCGGVSCPIANAPSGTVMPVHASTLPTCMSAPNCPVQVVAPWHVVSQAGSAGVSSVPLTPRTPCAPPAVTFQPQQTDFQCIPRQVVSGASVYGDVFGAARDGSASARLMEVQCTTSGGTTSVSGGRGVCRSTNDDVAELRVLLEARNDRIAKLEKQLEGAWQLVESSVAVSRLEETEAHFKVLIAERDGRIDAQNRLLEVFRRTIQEQNVEVGMLRQRLLSSKADGDMQRGVASCNSGSVPVRRSAATCGGEGGVVDSSLGVIAGCGVGENEHGGYMGAQDPHIPLISPWPPKEDGLPVCMPSGSSHAASPRSSVPAGASASAPPGRATPNTPFVPPLSFRSQVSDFLPASESAVAITPETSPLSSPRGLGASELVRVGDDPIDMQIRRYFSDHPSFQVFTNKLQPGWYTFGKPIQLKVFMKMAAGEVVVRTNRTFKRLERWLEEFRREAEAEEAEGTDRLAGDGTSRQRASSLVTATASGRRFSPRGRLSAAWHTRSEGRESRRDVPEVDADEATAPADGGGESTE
eukprot:TRINITY_DN43654_c0_g1_i1.p1 TRINITY_DN43654_c0_g1~~TRINITY_DN43654_c0_g1_i1.p1  ORF type:complete len:602 (-),score=72.08 TRINITY_DN43654_c0_g1_i1:374-2179(-)